MKRLILIAGARLFGEALVITLVVGLIVWLIGYLRAWDSPMNYSNAFFVAGCLVFIAGAASRMGTGQEWFSTRLIHAESFRGMSGSDQARTLMEASSSFRLVILGLVSCILLTLISELVPILFLAGD